jgi:glycosyltransferase involved in cell wall biosynthesis
MAIKNLVSCIIIFFNAEKYFEEAIESVLAQNYGNWELLLSDDGSTDSSTEIAQKYAQQYPNKIYYLEHESHQNRGMSATRNLGLSHATGEYVAFLDADDVWLPNKLEEQVAIMQAQPEVGMVYGRSLYWQSWSGKAEDNEKDYIPDAYVSGNQIYPPSQLLTLSYPLGKATPPPPTDIMLRRDAIADVGGFEAGFQKMYQLYEDQAFFSKFYLKFPVFVSNSCWDKYRLHPESCGSTVNKAGQYDQVRSFFLHWFEKYLKKEGITDIAVWDALNKAIFPYRYPVLFKLRKTPVRVKRMVKKLAGLTAN